jgi:hypothetical protein
MSHPFRRRADVPRPPHERARLLAARRLDEALAPADAEWLTRHLRECAGCAAIAETYDAQRLELRALRDRPPQPPRDLWARTAAAIEVEAARHDRRRGSRVPFVGGARLSPVPLGAISGLLVIAVVFGATLLSGRPIPTVQPTPSSPIVAQTTVPTRPSQPTPTPIVTAVEVSYGVVNGNTVELHTSTIDKVCTQAGSSECAAIDPQDPIKVDLPEAEVHSIIISPDSGQVVMLDEASAADGGKVVVVPVPTPTPAPGTTPPPTPSPSPTIAPTATPSDLPTASPPVSPSVTPSSTPTGSPPPSGEPAGGPQEIATDVILVGESASYSPDGTWFAFSARPADGSHGPDIFVWQANWPEAVAITTDHRSVLSAWVDGRILASRAVQDPEDGGSASPSGEPSNDPSRTPSTGPSQAPSGDPSVDPSFSPEPTPTGIYRPETFLIDPVTLEETVLAGVPAWRPSVDPSRGLAVYWDGTLRYDAEVSSWRPAEGRLVLGRWPAMPAAPVVEPDPSAEPGSSLEPAAEPTFATSAAPSLQPDASAELPSGSPEPQLEEPIIVLQEGAIRDWDARWDESGTHLAVWIADEHAPSTGRLTLRILDPETGEPTSDRPALNRIALPGFSIGEGRLAFATPGGEDGAGSKVVVVAWTDTAIGSVETEGGNEKVIIIR